MNFLSLHQTPLLVLLNIIMMLYFVVTLRPALNYFGRIPKDRFILVEFLIVLFCLFSFWGADWFHYAQIFAKIKNFGGTHMEDIYISIVNISPNYLVFRMIVWGAALFFVFDSFKRIGINYVVAVLIFSATWLIWFSYARVSLAMAMMFWGVSVLFNPLRKKQYLSTIIGLTAIIASFYFHKTAVFGISIIGISFLVSKLNGRTIIILSILLIPVEFLLVQHFLLDYMLIEVSAEDSVIGASLVSGQRYLGEKTIVSGFGSNVAKFLELVPYYLTLVCCLKLNLKRNRFFNIPNDIKIFAYIAFYTIIFSTIFAFDFGLSTEIFYGRFMRFAFLPCVIVITYCYELLETHKIAKYAIYSGVFSTIYQLLYVLYCALTKQ